MFRVNSRAHVLHDDHGTTNTATIARNVHRLVMVIDIDAHKLAETSSPAELAELSYETRWIASEPNDITIHVNHKSVWGIDLRPGYRGDICKCLSQRSNFSRRFLPSTPSIKASLMIGSSSTSVVMCVINARFFTNPQASPSGVSLGQSIPHWLGCNARGPLTFLVFSNCEDIRVIIPSAEMKLRRLRTCVTPARSILNRFKDQFPVDIARTKPDVMWSPMNCIVLYASNSLVREGFFNTLSMADFKFEL